ALGLTTEVVEKDYVLGWVLAGINNNNLLEKNWVFKGGTCLKKCYFETYRFSEDLDFTLSDESQLGKDFLFAQFNSVAEWVYENSGIQILKDLTAFDIHPDPTKKYVEGKIRYIGPLGERRGGAHAKIILDLSAKELSALPPERKQVFHPYSDQPKSGILARSYCFEEVFAEKIRALVERFRPRDLYDVIHLFRREAPVDKGRLLTTLQRKCEHKIIDLPTMASINAHPRYAELLSQWSSMLKHQLSALPPVESFLEDLENFFDWLYEDAASMTPDQISDEQQEATAPPITYLGTPKNVDETWVMPDRMVLPSPESSRIEKIRFAASNQLCLQITYTKKDGSTNNYILEPYAFVRTIGGDIYLAAVKADTGESRSFILSKMRTIKITEKAFRPRWPVEISTGGPLRIKQNEASRSASRWQSYGPKYVYRCSTCHRLFYKKSMDPTLRDHKNKLDQPCYGRYGSYIRTK
ncbi:MAG: nucleotidyl transferase AbiEii/AbiGii toxin family protein, partial [Bdellovibrionota bacterium]